MSDEEELRTSLSFLLAHHSSRITHHGQPIFTVNIDIEPPSNPSTGKLIASPG
jgi:hypothetical protein